ncbi:MAG: CBS domain-containing protein [bacterium]|nr:CBS domain-containing protein [bacterium]MCP5044681.1 CBS domain-containing protein [bacterium]
MDSDLVSVRELHDDEGGELRVRDLMTEEAVTFRRDDELILADQLMQLGRIRHIPVVADDGTSVIGILSQRDLFRGALARLLDGGGTAAAKTLSVGEVMVTEVMTVSPDETVAKAAETMLRDKIGCLPVVEAGAGLVGILTEADFVRYVGSR